MTKENVSNQDKLGSKSKFKIEKRERLTIAVFFIFSLTLAFSYHHLMQWGSFAMRLPVLKIEQAIGILDTKGFNEIAEICKARGNANCVRETYQDLYAHQNLEALALLAQFEAINHESASALKDFETYFKSGGRNFAFEYAVLLEQAHNYEASLAYFSLAAHGTGKIALTSTSEMLRIYMAQQKYEQAQHLLESFWERADKQRAYFNLEESQIQRYLNPQKTAGLEKSNFKITD